MKNGRQETLQRGKNHCTSTSKTVVYETYQKADLKLFPLTIGMLLHIIAKLFIIQNLGKSHEIMELSTSFIHTVNVHKDKCFVMI